MNGLLDTLINLEIFAFIGALLWLYFKDFDGPDDSAD
jgi:hypothetical protein